MPHLQIDRTATWHVASRVTKTRTASWNVAGKVTVTRSSSWNVAARLQLTRGAMWTVNYGNDSQPVSGLDCLPYNPVNRVFARVYVDHLVRGNSKVYWELARHFNDPGPLSFQLQVSESGLDNAADWTNVGQPVINNYYAVDPTRRLYGKQLLTKYRIRVIGATGTFYSDPIDVTGKLSKRDWNFIREITRKEILRLKRYTAIDGFLLIAKRSGEVCVCVDPLTGELTQGQCPICYGTGFTGGYYTPQSCTFFDMTPANTNEYRDLQMKGMTDDSVKEARFIGYPVLRARDVFVERDSDERYYLSRITNKAEIRGVQVVVAPILTLAPFTDIIYTFKVDR